MKKIYIIEDDAEITALLNIILENKFELGFSNSVQYVLDNPEIILNADLVITDFMSEDLTCTPMIEKFPDRKYLLITAYPADSQKLCGLMELENVDFLQKPFNITDLENKIESLL